MGNFQRNDRGGNRGGGFRDRNKGGRGGFGGGRREPVTMHKAVCDKCHQDCEVPFRPSGDKPIYCNECFGGKKDNGNRNQRKDFGNFKPKREFNDKPMQSFPQNGGVNISDDIKKQLTEMNGKLDRLINVMENLSIPKTPSAKKTSTKTLAKKTAIKKKK